jgi:hypothetical protein
MKSLPFLTSMFGIRSRFICSYPRETEHNLYIRWMLLRYRERASAQPLPTLLIHCRRFCFQTRFSYWQKAIDKSGKEKSRHRRGNWISIHWTAKWFTVREAQVVEHYDKDGMRRRCALTTAATITQRGTECAFYHGIFAASSQRPPSLEDTISLHSPSSCLVAKNNPRWVMG